MPEKSIQTQGSSMTQDLEGEMERVKGEIQSMNNDLQSEMESSKRLTLKEEIKLKELLLTDLQTKMDKAGTPRRSARPANPTEKMRGFQKEIATNKIKPLLSSYDQWKLIARDTRKR